MRMTKSIQNLERGFDAKAERFLWRHPILGFFSIFIGMPLLTLAGVCASTVLVVFPIGWLLGWL